jgi:regulator of CtrA degradation
MSATQHMQMQQPAPTAFFTKTYDEAIGLLLEARDYVARREPTDRARLDGVDRIRMCCETMRMTARLTQIMSWLLAQRAVFEGEMTEAEVVDRHQALAELQVCMEEAEAMENLPPHLQRLLERTHRLYIRVARLDEMVRRKVLH